MTSRDVTNTPLQPKNPQFVVKSQRCTTPSRGHTRQRPESAKEVRALHIYFFTAIWTYRDAVGSEYAATKKPDDDYNHTKV